MRTRLLFCMFIAALLLLAGCAAEMKATGGNWKEVGKETAKSAKINATADVQVEAGGFFGRIGENRNMRLSGLPAGAKVFYPAKSGETLERKVDGNGNLTISVPKNTTIEINVVSGPFGKGFKAVLDTDIDYRWNKKDRRYIRLTTHNH